MSGRARARLPNRTRLRQRQPGDNVPLSLTDEQLPHVEAALAELLLRTTLERTQAGDPERAHALLRRLARDDVDALVLAAAATAVSAAFDATPQLEREVHLTALLAARALTQGRQPPRRVLLGATALILSAQAGRSDKPVDDLLLAALAARNIEQHTLCAVAARNALSHDSLNTSQRARAWLLLALVERDPDAIEQAAALVPQLDPDDPTRIMAEAVWPTLDPDINDQPLTQIGASIRANDRPGAASDLAATFRELSHEHGGDELLKGLVITMDALAQPEIDVREARRGLARAIRHWHEHRSMGDTPAIAKAGIEIALDLLTIDPGEGGADLLCETVEALADAGLSTLSTPTRTGRRDVASPAVAHATLAARAAGSWPNLAWIASRLGDTHVLLTRTQRRWTDGATEILALHIRPPNGVAIKKVILNTVRAATLAHLASEEVAQVAQVTLRDLDELVEALLPKTLAKEIDDRTIGSLLVVPDGPLWSVPWHATSLARDSRIALTACPSMSLWAALDPPTTPVRSIFAFVDDKIPGAQPLIDALTELRADGQLAVSWGRTGNDLNRAADHDLLLVFGHGAGAGLNYQLALPEETITAYEIATAPPPKRALIAGCWSAAAPPVSFPLSVPAALLLTGCKTVVGGLWPLPVTPTAAITAHIVHALANGSSLAAALPDAVAATALPELVDHAGLALFGRDDRSPT